MLHTARFTFLAFIRCLLPPCLFRRDVTPFMGFASRKHSRCREGTI